VSRVDHVILGLPEGLEQTVQRGQIGIARQPPTLLAELEKFRPDEDGYATGTLQCYVLHRPSEKRGETQ
jgi:hypothetical protein